MGGLPLGTSLVRRIRGDRREKGKREKQDNDIGFARVRRTKGTGFRKMSGLGRKKTGMKGGGTVNGHFGLRGKNSFKVICSAGWNRLRRLMSGGCSSEHEIQARSPRSLQSTKEREARRGPMEPRITKLTGRGMRCKGGSSSGNESVRGSIRSFSIRG